MSRVIEVVAGGSTTEEALAVEHAVATKAIAISEAVVLIIGSSFCWGCDASVKQFDVTRIGAGFDDGEKDSGRSGAAARLLPFGGSTFPTTPWPGIYVTDEERTMALEQVVLFHDVRMSTYEGLESIW